jgi:hypothetical protein
MADKAGSPGEAGLPDRKYSKIKNLVLWARSEKIRRTVHLRSGVLESWSVGVLELGLVE